MLSVKTLLWKEFLQLRPELSPEGRWSGAGGQGTSTGREQRGQLESPQQRRQKQLQVKVERWPGPLSHYQVFSRKMAQGDRSVFSHHTVALRRCFKGTNEAREAFLAIG